MHFPPKALKLLRYLTLPFWRNLSTWELVSCFWNVEWFTRQTSKPKRGSIFAFCVLLTYCFLCHKFGLTTARCSCTEKAGKFRQGFSLSWKSVKSYPTVIHSSIWKAKKLSGWAGEVSSFQSPKPIYLWCHIWEVPPFHHGSSCYESLYSVSMTVLLSWESDTGDQSAGIFCFVLLSGYHALHKHLSCTFESNAFSLRGGNCKV